MAEAKVLICSANVFAVYNCPSPSDVCVLPTTEHRLAFLNGAACDEDDTDVGDNAATAGSDDDLEEGGDDPDARDVGEEYPNCYFPGIFPAIGDPRFDALFSKLPSAIARPPGIFHNVRLRL